MDNKLLNLADAAGMRYAEGLFYFTYEQLQQFYQLVVQEQAKRD